MAATLAMGMLALLGGVWRHFSGDYGPRLAVVSGLLLGGSLVVVWAGRRRTQVGS